MNSYLTVAYPDPALGRISSSLDFQIHKKKKMNSHMTTENFFNKFQSVVVCEFSFIYLCISGLHITPWSVTHHHAKDERAGERSDEKLTKRMYRTSPDERSDKRWDETCYRLVTTRVTSDLFTECHKEPYLGSITCTWGKGEIYPAISAIWPSPFHFASKRS